MRRSMSGSSNSKSHRGGSGKKSKSSDQKTLGAVWGANSSRPSSVRSSPFTDFGSYMNEKNRKLQNQFKAAASNSSEGGSDFKPIFRGVSIFVDGFTIPSGQELRGYMMKYGGRFENYFSRHRVTHIICSNLPDSKIKNLQSFSRGLPVVKPGWVVDSIAASKLLDWVPYVLDQLASDQPKLSAFFGPKTISVMNDVSTGVSNQRLGTSLNNQPPDGLDVSELNGILEIGCNVGLSNSHMQEIGDSCSIDGNSIELKYSDLDDDKHTIGGDTVDVVMNRTGKQLCNDMKADSSLEMEAAVPYKPQRSTLEDPNFVENYFKNSRLHFIGTWRNRYLKRFSNQSAEISTSKEPSGNHLSDSEKTSIIHIDLDCFFVSVITRKYPQMRNKPVAVCHSSNSMGTAEISSANYPARSYGIKAGIFVRSAKQLCPELIVVPYDFEAYEEVSDQFYQILHKHCNKVQAVSCDEAFVAIMDSEKGDPETLALTIRKEIFETTGCTASAGISVNMLMARLATKKAKPDGQYYIPAEKVEEFLDHLLVKDLPGIGYVLAQKLEKQRIFTCDQLRLWSKESLQKELGKKTGEMLWNYSRGVDNRQVGVSKEIKSVGAEVNWGVRFKDMEDCYQFLLNLCKEVSFRLQGCRVMGRTFTLKIKKRRKDAEEPVKFMGCGDCENLSRSVTVPRATDDVKLLEKISKKLFQSFHIDVREIRGVGLQVSKLAVSDASKQGIGSNFLSSWLASSSTLEGNDNRIFSGNCDTDSRIETENGVSKWWNHNREVTSETHSDTRSSPPPLCNLDVEVVENLPSDVFIELNNVYDGKLTEFVAKYKRKHDTVLRCNPSVVSKQEEHQHNDDNVVEPYSNDILMPSSLSQVDRSVLQELPEDVKNDIFGLLPAHRRQNTNCSFDHTAESNDANIKNEPLTPIECNQNRKLWHGNPPLWVNKFKASSSWILRRLVELYHRYNSGANLSNMLQNLVPSCGNESFDGLHDDDVHILCDFFKHYIEMKVQSDIEEINLSFLILKRIAVRSTKILQVYNLVLPYLQASIGEHYGGSLNLVQLI